MHPEKSIFLVRSQQYSKYMINASFDVCFWTFMILNLVLYIYFWYPYPVQRMFYLGSESGKKVLKKQSKIINEPNSLEPESQYSQVKPPGTQYSNIRPPGTHNSYMQPPGTQDWNTRPSETQNSSMRPSGTHNSNRRPPGTQDSQTRPAKRTVERQNSNSQSSAFGAIADPGDKNVTNWKDAYSDLHKCWSYQNSQIEELTSRQVYHTLIYK